METVSHRNKDWIVKHKSEKAIFSAVGKDDNGNPKSDFIETDWISPKEVEKKHNDLKAQYGSTKVMKHWAWEIRHLFREEIAKNSNAKTVQTYTLQREFKDGKWNTTEPADFASNIAGTKPAKPINWGKHSWKAWCIIVGIGVAIYLIYKVASRLW